MPARNAVSVLPEPVGAAIRQSSPERIAGQPPSCAKVGVPKRSENQSRTMGWKSSRTEGMAECGSYVPIG